LPADLRAGTPQYTFSPLVTTYEEECHNLKLFRN
jgi:hypothetical protein